MGYLRWRKTVASRQKGVKGIEMNDEEKDARRNPVGAELESVATGRIIEEIAEAAPGF